MSYPTARNGLGTEPIEVTDMILDNLRADGSLASLAAFSRACKHYHDIANRFLWRDVPITAVFAHGIANATSRPGQFRFHSKPYYQEHTTPYVAGLYKEMVISEPLDLPVDHSFDHPEYSDVLDLYRIKPNYDPFLMRLASHIRTIHLTTSTLASVLKYVDLSLPPVGSFVLPNLSEISITVGSSGHSHFNLAKHLLPHISQYFHRGLQILNLTVFGSGGGKYAGWEDVENWEDVEMWLLIAHLVSSAAQRSAQLKRLTINASPFLYSQRHQTAFVNVLAQFTELQVLCLPMSALTPSLLLAALKTLRHVELILPSTHRMSTDRVVQTGTLQVPDDTGNQRTTTTESERIGCRKLTSLTLCTTTDQIIPLLSRAFPETSHHLTALTSLAIHIAPQHAAAQDFFGFDTLLAHACPALTCFRLEFLRARDFAAFTATTPTLPWPLFRAFGLCKCMQYFSVICPSAMAFTLPQIGEMLAEWPAVREVVVAGASGSYADRVVEGMRSVDVSGESEAASFLMGVGMQAWEMVDAQCPSMYGEIFCAAEYDDGIFGWHFQLKVNGAVTALM